METWSTREALTQARERMAAAIPGWQAPYAHGIGFVPSSVAKPASEHFPLVNTAGHLLPALVVAGVVGHTSGTAAYRLTRAQLELAVKRLSPAEAFTGGEGHPNLWTWRDTYLRDWAADPGAQAVAVFLAGPEITAGDPADDAVSAFRAALGRTDERG